MCYWEQQQLGQQQHIEKKNNSIYIIYIIVYMIKIWYAYFGFLFLAFTHMNELLESLQQNKRCPCTSSDFTEF
jgi:hypothetical protein